MSEKLHIILAGDHNSTRSLVFSKKTLKIGLGLIVLTIGVSIICNCFTAGLFHESKKLTGEVANLKRNLSETSSANEQYADQVAQLQYKLKYQLTQFQAEKQEIVNTAVNELKQRSQFIENVMDDIGVKIKKKSLDSPGKNSGGPFLTIPEADQKSLINQTDKYLKVMSTLPLGRPVAGPVTSSYGSRRDPVNKRKGYHSGVDFRGKYGTDVLATADGKVIKAGRNGSFGLFVQVDHGNGYSTCFAHLSKYTVKKGERVRRGQTVGKIGSSGRSTGPHLHYELRYNNKPVNPTKFLKVADLSFLSTSQ